MLAPVWRSRNDAKLTKTIKNTPKVVKKILNYTLKTVLPVPKFIRMIAMNKVVIFASKTAENALA